MKKLFFLLSLVLMFFPMGVFACGEENEANMMGWNWGTGGGMMGGWSTPFNTNQSFQSMMGFGFTPLGAFGWIFMILWWVLIVVAIVALVRWLMRQSSDTERKGEKTALEILKQRYAKGEIDKQEFEEKKNDIG